MCWINWFTFKDENLIKKMNLAIKHRWPDGEWYFNDSLISLWHVRLAIQDISENWKQPMFYSKKIGAFYYDIDRCIYIDNNNKEINKDIVDKSYCIIFNWEIFNFKIIREDLLKKWYKFTTWTDTEIILASFIEYWNSCHEKFSWMWAFSLYDIYKWEIIFSRDRIWIKPLYYHRNSNNDMVYSSEIKWILEYEWYEKKVNDYMVYQYLVYEKDTHIKQTFFDWVNKFPNASYWVFDLKSKDFKIEKYWDLKFWVEKWNQTFEDRKKIIKDSFINTIKEHSISDVEIWVCLSGGLDSSSIVYSLDKIYDSNKELKTFSLVSPWESMDESYYINIVNKEINSSSVYITIGSNELLNDLNDFVYYQEEPVISTSMYAHYKVMEWVNKNNIKVTLDGQWWDEVFGWYNTFYSYYIYEYFIKFQYIKLFKFIYWMKKYYSKSIFKSIIFPLWYLLYLLLPNKIKKIYRENNRKYIKKDFLKKNSTNHERHKSISFINKWYYLQQIEIIQNLLRYVDKNSMKWSIESRVPFLDYKLMEAVWKIPNEEKIKNWLTKHILRESMEWLLNEEIKDRYDKNWFETPENKLLKSKEMIEFLDNNIFLKNSKLNDYIDIDKFKNKYTDFVNWKKINSTEIWKVINLWLWLKIYF